LQELPNVIAALPFGDTHKVKVLTSKPKSFDKKAAIAILDGTDYEVVGFTYKVLGTAKTKVKKGE